MRIAELVSRGAQSGVGLHPLYTLDTSYAELLTTSNVNGVNKALPSRGFTFIANERGVNR